MAEIILTVGLLVIQILLYHFVKQRWVLLILPALLFVLYLITVFRGSNTQMEMPQDDYFRVKVFLLLLYSVNVLIVLIPFAFTFMKRVGWRVLIVAIIVFAAPIAHGVSTKAHDFSSILYTIKIQYYTPTEPYVRFKFNFLRDRYGDRYDPPKPPETTRSQPSTTTKPSQP